MTTTSFVFLLAVITIAAALFAGTWQLLRVRRARRDGETTAAQRQTRSPHAQHPPPGHADHSRA